MNSLFQELEQAQDAYVSDHITTAYGEEAQISQAYMVKLVGIGHRYLKENKLMPQSGSGLSNLVEELGDFSFGPEQYESAIRMSIFNRDRALKKAAKQDGQNSWKMKAIALVPFIGTVIANTAVNFKMLPQEISEITETTMKAGFVWAIAASLMPEKWFLKEGLKQSQDLHAEARMLTEDVNTLIAEDEDYPIAAEIVSAFIANDPSMLENSDYPLETLNGMATVILHKKLQSDAAQPV